MKTIKHLTSVTLIATFLAAPLVGLAADKKDEKAKAYPLDKCLVSDEKLDEMGKPYVFTYKGQEIKMCCKSCLKDFNKDPDTYLKKLEKAEADKAKK